MNFLKYLLVVVLAMALSACGGGSEECGPWTPSGRALFTTAPASVTKTTVLSACSMEPIFGGILGLMRLEFLSFVDRLLRVARESGRAHWGDSGGIAIVILP